jgi:hypothetical protein
MTDEDGWKPIAEPIELPADGGEVYWIEDGDRYKIIPKSSDAPWTETPCFYASYQPAPPQAIDITWIEIE